MCKKLIFAVILLGTMLPGVGVAFGDPAVQAQRVAELAGELTCNWEGLTAPNECGLESFERTVVSGSVVEYTFELRVGPGEYDKLRLHRVVEERRPYQPKFRPRGVMLLHGDLWPFDGVFMAAVGSGVVPEERALPVYLAKHRVDAWGVDLRWALVPGDVPDPNLVLENWGLQTDIDDLGVALQFMRVLRLFTGSGFQKVSLLGWSRGGITGYAYLGMESQRPAPLRHVKAFIPVDIFAKTDDEIARQEFCRRKEFAQAAIEQGVFAFDTRVFALAGDLAIEDPDGPSPLVPGLSNQQVIVVDAGVPRNSITPWFHYLAAELDSGFPVGLKYTEVPLASVHYSRGAAFGPFKLRFDGAVMICDEEESPFDDHFSDITIPVLYVAADGGVSDTGLFNLTLLGSSDVGSLIVDLTDLNQEDFGHSDIFLAANAEELVWAPMLDWIRQH